MSAGRPRNPYRGLKDHQFWRQSVSFLPPGLVDPVTESRRIGPTDRVSTMGSCFSQNIGRHLHRLGANFHVTEEDPSAAEAGLPGVRGVFSARYGNVYTARQAVQLFKRSYGLMDPVEVHWERTGVFVDPFRPRIEPEGFASVAQLVTARADHFKAVRAVFEDSEWIVFTLGMTETWMDRRDGAVYPVAPGVAGGSFDPAIHRFVNFSVQEIISDLEEFVRLVADVNRRCHVILTVSPVPMIATYENRHVLASNAYSKSVLRVAADEVERRFRNVHYFPSYEVITSPAGAGHYYQDDLRQVNKLGISHVMRLFEQHFMAGQRTPGTIDAALIHGDAEAPPVVCDEETIERSIRDNTSP